MSRALIHNTVRIEAQMTNGVSIGTGFFYGFFDEKTKISIPVVVTCWHVVSGSLKSHLFVTADASNGPTRISRHLVFDVPKCEDAWIRHPDTNIDLAVLPIGHLMADLESNGMHFSGTIVGDWLVANDTDLEQCGVFQEVKFIGYPIGIWDQLNNLPVARRGMTATDPVVDYNGRTEFLIDAAVFPGSSGSPVFIADASGLRKTGKGVSGFMPERVRLMGILYAGETYTVDGKLEIVTIPTAFDAKVKTTMPSNLGVVVKANRLAAFKEIFKEIIKKQQDSARKADETKTNSTAK